MRRSALTCILALVQVGCSTPTARSLTEAAIGGPRNVPKLTTRVSRLPKEVRQGDKVTFEVAVTNRTRETVLVPPSYYDGDRLVMDQTGVVFVTDPKNPPIVRMSVSTSPPISDWIEPGETKLYPMTWTPTNSDLGSGFLVVGLPGEFQEIKPHPIRVTE